MARRKILGMFCKAQPVVDAAPAQPAPAAYPDRPAQPEPLPDAVIDVLDSASVLFRQDTGEGAHADQAIVQLPNGTGGFRFSPEAAAKVIGRCWPELGDVAVSQAARRLGGIVSARRRQHAADAAARADALSGRMSGPWLHRY